MSVVVVVRFRLKSTTRDGDGLGLGTCIVRGGDADYHNGVVRKLRSGRAVP